MNNFLKDKSLEDWLERAVRAARELLASLPPELRTAVDDDYAYREAMLERERGETTEFWDSVERISTEQRKLPKEIRELSGVSKGPWSHDED